MAAARMLPSRIFAIVLLAFATVSLSWSFASALLPKAAADRVNNPPGKVTCANAKASCHVSPPPGANQGALEVTGIPTCYQPGQKYTFNVKVSDPNATRWGFELGVQYNEGNENDNRSAGALGQAPNARTAIVPSTDGMRQFSSHDRGSANGDGTYNGQANSANWNVEWTAPADRTTPVCIYVAGVAADGDGSSDGDRTYLFKQCLQSCLPVSTHSTTWGKVKSRFYR